MRSSKLKALLITACCLVFALFAKGQAMNDATNSQEITLCNIGHSEAHLESLKLEADDDRGLQGTMLQPQQNDEDESSSPSWASYVTTPIKAAINKTYDIAGYSVRHPNQAIITSLLVAAQFTFIAADCNCLGWTSNEYCASSNSKDSGTPASYGMFPNATSCEQFINLFFRNSQPYVCYYGCQ